MHSNRIQVCRNELREALTTIQDQTALREEAITRLDALIEVLREIENGNMFEAQELIFEACLRFGVNCL